MNREIKFKAYQKSKNYIYKVLSINFEGYNQSIREVKLSNGDIITSNRIDDLIFMEYTSLKDKNGVEIYEGDIVNHYIHGDHIDKSDWKIIKGEVIREGSFWYVLSQAYPLYTFENEIIGNIYEK